MNLTLYAGLFGVISSLALAFLWQTEKTLNAELQAQLSGKNQIILILNGQLKEQKSTLIKNLEVIAKNQDILSKYNDAVAIEQLKVQKLQNDINNLRARELENAMQDPYNRGNRATERWNHVMQLISGADDRKNTDSSSYAQSSNP